MSPEKLAIGGHGLDIAAILRQRPAPFSNSERRPESAHADGVSSS
jgi:hypothetical protein